MTYRERMTIQLILLAARLVSGNAELARELKTIATSIGVHGGEVEP